MLNLRNNFQAWRLPALLLVLGAALAFGKDDKKEKGPDRFVARMEKELSLTKEQSEKIRAILKRDSGDWPHRGHWKKGHGRHGFGGFHGGHGAFLEQLRAASVDTSALNRNFEERMATMRERHASFVAKFAEVHAVLTPEQRAKAAEHIEKRAAKMEKKHGKKQDE